MLIETFRNSVIKLNNFFLDDSIVFNKESKKKFYEIFSEYASLYSMVSNLYGYSVTEMAKLIQSFSNLSLEERQKIAEKTKFYFENKADVLVN